LVDDTRPLVGSGATTDWSTRVEGQRRGAGVVVSNPPSSGQEKGEEKAAEAAAEATEADAKKAVTAITITATTAAATVTTTATAEGVVNNSSSSSSNARKGSHRQNNKSNSNRKATATNARTKSLLFGFMTTEKAEYVRSLCLHSTDGEAISVCFFLILFDVI
jgi:predicted phage tail protein